MKLEHLPTIKFLELNDQDACNFILRIREERRKGKIKKERKSVPKIERKNITSLITELSQSEKERLRELLLKGL